MQGIVVVASSLAVDGQQWQISEVAVTLGQQLGLLRLPADRRLGQGLGLKATGTWCLSRPRFSWGCQNPAATSS